MHSRQLKPLPCNRNLLRSEALRRQRGNRWSQSLTAHSLWVIWALLSLSTQVLRRRSLSAFQSQSGDLSAQPSFLTGQFGFSELQHWDGLHGVRSGVSRAENPTASLCSLILGLSSPADIGSLLGLVAAATLGTLANLRLLIVISVCLGHRLKQVNSAPLSLKSLHLARRLTITGMRSGRDELCLLVCPICVTASTPQISD